MTDSLQTASLPASSLPPNEVHRRLCNYVALPEVHERLAELAWGDALSRDRAERLGLTRSFGVRKCHHFTAERGDDLRCEQREEYLDESPVFKQTTTELGHRPWPHLEEAVLGPVDVYLNGRWRYRYRRYWAHFERSRQSTERGWEASIFVNEERSPEAMRHEDRVDFEIGVIVKATAFSAESLAFEFDRFRRARPDMRFALMTPFALTRSDSMILDKAQVTLIHPGYAFDASTVAGDAAAPPAEL
jgi:hypothetical protein